MVVGLLSGPVAVEASQTWRVCSNYDSEDPTTSSTYNINLICASQDSEEPDEISFFLHFNAYISASQFNTIYGSYAGVSIDTNSDGEFDVLLVRPVSKFVLLTIFPKVFFGRHIPHPKIDVYRGKDVAVSGKTKAFADGEYIDDLPIRIQNIQNSLSTWLFV